jgi:hypothetical protein
LTAIAVCGWQGGVGKEVEMLKLAVVVLADTDTHEALGRAVNALEVAKELKEAGDEVAILFDGAGTKWVPTLDDPEHRRHALWLAVKDKVAGACSFCAAAFGAKAGVERAGVALLDAFDRHPSLRAYLAEGYQVVTF